MVRAGSLLSISIALLICAVVHPRRCAPPPPAGDTFAALHEVPPAGDTLRHCTKSRQRGILLPHCTRSRQRGILLPLCRKSRQRGILLRRCTRSRQRGILLRHCPKSRQRGILLRHCTESRRRGHLPIPLWRGWSRRRRDRGRTYPSISSATVSPATGARATPIPLIFNAQKTFEESFFTIGIFSPPIPMIPLHRSAI